MHRRYKKMSLKKRIILLIVLISIYPILLMGFFGAYNYENLIKDRFISYSQKDMDMIGSYINKDVQDMKKFILNILSDQGFYELTNSKPNMNDQEIKNYIFKRNMENYLSVVTFSNGDFDVAGFCFEEDDYLYYAAQETGKISSQDFPIEKLRALVKESNQSVFYIEKSDVEINVYIARRVLHKDTFKPIGLLFFRMDPDYLVNMIKDSYKETAETIYLYTEDGLLVSKEGLNQENSIISDNRYFDIADGIYVEKGSTNTYYIVTKKIHPLNLTAITMISNDLLTSDLRKITDLILILCALNIPLYLIIANFLYGNIARPINYLIEKMHLFEQGKLDKVKDPKRNDEIGYLFQAFIKMTNNINTLIKDVYTKELARKDAEIAALQEQINPHFLYNTLESINWRAQLAGETDIALMIQALSKLMDAGINRGDEKYVTIEQEVVYMDQYMFLVQKRYENRIEFIKEIDDNAKTMMVPKLIIQPIIENAVKHGIEPVGEGKICLKAYLEEDVLVIDIEDNGEGMLSPKIKQIERLFLKEKNLASVNQERSRSIGLQNVARRLYLIYDNEAEIIVQSFSGKGTKITIKIPPIMEDNQNEL